MIVASAPIRFWDWVYQRAQMWRDHLANEEHLRVTLDPDSPELSGAARVLRQRTALQPSRRRDSFPTMRLIQKVSQMLADFTVHATDIYWMIDNYGELYWAYIIHSNPTYERYRLYIEAGLLGGLSNEEVAGYCGAEFSPRIVEHYEQVFYNVRRDLPHRCAVAAQVMLRAPIEARRLDLPILWRMIAYFKGFPLALALVDSFIDVDRATHEMVVSAMNDDAIEAIKVQALIAARTFGTGSQGANELLATFVKNREIEMKEELSDTATDNMEAALTALVTSLAGRVTIGNHLPKTGLLVDPLPRLNNNTAVELPESTFRQPRLMQRLDSASFPGTVASTT